VNKGGCEESDLFCSATTVSSDGNSLNGEFRSEAGLRFFSFDAGLSKTYTVMVWSETMKSSICIYDPDKKPIASVAPKTGWKLTQPGTGTHYISFLGEDGDKYSITVEPESNSDSDQQISNTGNLSACGLPEE